MAWKITDKTNQIDKRMNWNKLKVISPLMLLIALLCSSCTKVSVEKQPNIIIIFTDDQGYADVGVYGAKGFETPHLDKMATEAMKFTDFYVASSVCSPSRAALLTTCYPQRIGIGRKYTCHIRL